MEEKFVKNFEVSPDGLFMLLTGTSGYLHLLSMKVAFSIIHVVPRNWNPFPFESGCLPFNLRSNATFQLKRVWCTVTAFESELLYELTVTMENGLGMSDSFLWCSFWDWWWRKSRVFWWCLLGRGGGGGWVTGKSHLSMMCYNWWCKHCAEKTNSLSMGIWGWKECRTCFLGIMLVCVGVLWSWITPSAVIHKEPRVF